MHVSRSDGASTEARPLFQGRIDSLRYRIDGLAELRRLIRLAPDSDISARQWAVLEPQLHEARNRISRRVKSASSSYYASGGTSGAASALTASLGRAEMDLARAYGFFDTYMDVITQRHSHELGPLLAGCDVLAFDAMRRDHPALRIIEPPLVFCDRGFGASIIREDVAFPDGTPNPMPLIQIPYSRLRQKCNLTSILHEAGHQALVRTGMVQPLADAFRLALRGAGAIQQQLAAQWAFEIGPDFWSFCLSGVGAAATLLDILALPPRHVYRILPADPHPPPYLRTLLGFECCRQLWGRGIWDGWEEEWRTMYPLGTGVARAPRRVLEAFRRELPRLAETLLATRFRPLERRRLSDLFDLRVLHPQRIETIVDAARQGTLRLAGLPAAAHLGVFRVLRERLDLPEEKLDALMSRWLLGLGRARGRWSAARQA